MFYEPHQTQYDLNFRLLGIPVRIHPFFWILTLLLGARLDATALVTWILAVTLSILVHEFGHALAWRFFGIHTRVVLYSFGGLTIANRGFRLRWFENAFISFAGPFAGFILFGLAAGLIFLQGVPTSLHGRNFLGFLLEINLFWGILNLMPIYPLDGGQIVHEVAAFLSPSRGLVWTLQISIVAALILIGGALVLHQTFLALMFGWMAFSNYQVLKQITYRY